MLALRQSVMRAFRHRDFRLLWYGAFLSFVGSWIQKAGEGWLVQTMYHNISLLTLISFCAQAPVSVLGPFAGTLADAFDKKVVLNVAQVLFGLGAIYLGVVCVMHRVVYGELLAVALLFGIVGAFEGPTRQSVVSRVVPPEDLAHAVPLNAMTFNVARLIGPAIAGALLAILTTTFDAQVGSGICYTLNGISYLALVFAVLAIRANLKPTARSAQPVGDLIVEGMKYTFRDDRFRTLFFMEVIASSCGMFYISVMPAFTSDILGMGAGGYAMAMSMVGTGAIAGLLMMIYFADMPIKSQMVRLGMLTMGIAIFMLGYVRAAWLAYPLIALIGASVIVQFNTTNTLFQLLSPDRLRGRVLAMHQWAIGGLGPFGTLFFGWFAEYTKTPHRLSFSGMSVLMPVGGLPLALKIGGACILLGAMWGSFRVRSFALHQWEPDNRSLLTETAS